MSNIIHTFCRLRLGDNLQHLHFIRKLSQKYPERQFVHFLHAPYLAQCHEVVEDRPNVGLVTIETAGVIPADAIDGWKGAGNYWYSHPDRNDYVKFYVQFFDMLAAQMGLENPIKCAADFLFDYPAINFAQGPQQDFDFLVVNSPPLSNQFTAFDPMRMHELVYVLSQKHSIITTAGLLGAITNDRIPRTTDYNLTAGGIGNVSLRCKNIIMVSTGPSWPTFNVWRNQPDGLRIILIDTENVNIDPNAVTLRRVGDCYGVLEERGLL